MIQKKGNVVFLYLIIMIVAIIFCSCSSAIELQSEKKKTDIKIDGDNSEWNGPFYSVTEEEIMIKANNDENDLYLCILFQNKRKAFQYLAQGLTVWFDNEGSKDEKFGIHFPLGFGGGSMPGMMMRERNRDQEDIEKEQNERIDIMKESLAEMEILGPKKNDVERILVSQMKDISIGLKNTDRILIYELRVPLKKYGQVKYAINYDPQIPIGIGIKAGKAKDDRMMGQMPGGGPPQGGMPPGGGMSPGGQGGRSGGRNTRMGERPETFKQISLWFKVSLTN